MDLTLIKEDRKVEIKKLSSRKKHFNLGKRRNLGVIRILRRKTNIFIIFEDLDSKTIICRTSGSAGIIGSKRIKRVPQAVENIFKVLYPHLKLYRVKKVRIILNTRLNACFYIFLRLLETYGIRVRQCCVRRKIAFNGCKGRKVRRV